MTDRRNRATYQAIAHPAGPSSEPMTFRNALTRVVASVGSVQGAARELGVPRRTLRRWLAGENTPAAARQSEVRKRAGLLVRRSRLPPTREVRRRRATRVQIKAIFRYDGTLRDLTFLVGGSGPTGMLAGTPDRTVSAFLAGAEGRDIPDPVDGGSGLFGPLARGMTDNWYRERFLLGSNDDQGFDVQTVRFL